MTFTKAGLVATKPINKLFKNPCYACHYNKNLLAKKTKPYTEENKTECVIVWCNAKSQSKNILINIKRKCMRVKNFASDFSTL